jgi:hypothetical protein
VTVVKKTSGGPSGSGAAALEIEGTLNSTPNTQFLLEFFANSAQDPSGFGEGEIPIGRTNVTTNGSGNATFDVILASPLASGFVTATATRFIFADASSGVVDASFIGDGRFATVDLHVRTQRNGRARGMVNVVVPGVREAGGSLAMRSTRIEDMIVVEGGTVAGAGTGSIGGGPVAVVIGVMQVSRLGRVPFVAVASDGGTPGVPGDSFQLVLGFADGVAGQSKGKFLQIGGPLLFYNQNIRFRNDIIVSPSIFRRR